MTRLMLAGLVALVALTGCGPAATEATAETDLVASVIQDPQPGDPAPEARAGAARHLLRKAVLHGEFVVKGRDGQVRTVVVQRGTVTAVGAGSLGVRSSDGFAQTYALNEAVKVVVDGHKGDLGTVQMGTVQVGVEVGVAADKSGDAVTARLIAVPKR